MTRPLPTDHGIRARCGAVLRRLAPAALCALALAGCADPSARGGDVRLDEGRPEEAEAQYRQALARDPDNAEAHFRLAQVLAGQGRTADAVVHYDRAAALDRDYGARAADDRRRYLRRFVAEAKSLLAEGRPEEAEAALVSATDLVPADAETQVLQGRLREHRGDLPGAVESYRRALTLDPGRDEAEEALAGALADLGRERYDAGRFGEAEALVAEALTLDSDPDLHYLQGTIAYARAQQITGDARMEQLNRAASEFRLVLRADPGDDDARFNLGAVLLASEQFEAAAEVYLELIARNPKQGDLYMALARAHSLAGELSLTATEEAIGRALRVGEPVDDPSRWARLSAERFPHTELATTYFDLMVPDAIQTYTLPGGGLVEVWFYWRESVVEAFREGGRLGPTFNLPRP